MSSIDEINEITSSFRDLRERLGLQRVEDPEFFYRVAIARFRANRGRNPGATSPGASVFELYLNYLEDGEVSEGTPNLILLSPLLDALGLCDPPDRLRGEAWVGLQLPVDGEEGPIALEGPIDALTLRDTFWLVVIEGKRGGFNVLHAIPQAIACTSANPNRDRPRSVTGKLAIARSQPRRSPSAPPPTISIAEPQDPWYDPRGSSRVASPPRPFAQRLRRRIARRSPLLIPLSLWSQSQFWPPEKAPA